MINRNYHTHMKYCNHAIGDVKDYVEFAIKSGYIELGMSDHAPIPLDSMTEEEWHKNYCNENMSLETFEIYLKNIEECQDKYKNIKIYKALESEYLDGYDYHYQYLRSKLDYMIFGIHFYKYDGRVIDTYNDCNYDTIEGYLNNAIKGMKSGLFKYLAHPDLFYFNYKDKNGNHTFDDRCVMVTKKIIECAIKNDIYLEINANGLKFSDLSSVDKWKYPNINFWNIAKEYKDLKVIIGADCHKPELLDSDWIRMVEKFAQDLGIKVLDKMEL